MVEVVVRVDDVVDVLRAFADQGQRTRDRLFGRLHGLLEGQHLHDVVIVVAGVEEVEAVLVLDQDRVGGEAHLAARTPVPEGLEAIDHQTAAVQQVDFRFAHFLYLL